MKRSLAFLVLLTATANADPKHVLVLRAEGNANADARGKIDTQVLKLAKTIPGNVEAGDISFTDAAAAVGCSPSDAPCRDEVLATMGVDELVATTVTSAPNGELKITVRRIAKGTPPKEASTSVPNGQMPDAKMNADIGPMFGLVQATPPPPPDKTAVPPGDGSAAAPPPGTGSGSAAPDLGTATPPPPPPDAHAPAPTTTAQADTHVTAAPNGQIPPQPEGTSDNHRLEVTGMAAGGGLFVVGVILWLEASSTQSDINAAPTRSPRDFQSLTDLESRGDAFATFGNIAAIGGLALAGISGFFYWHDRGSHSSHQARLGPAVFPHGGGITFTVGGAP